MVRRAIFVAALLVICVPVALPEQSKPPAIVGYVTAVTSSTAFDVNGTHILCDGSTQFSVMDAKGNDLILSTPGDRYIGQPVDVYGKANKKRYTIHATQVVTHPPDDVKLSGMAIIDDVPDNTAQAKGERLLRADGYLILVTSKTQTTFTAPLTSLADVGTNVWIKYTGKQRPDGVLVADTAVFAKNVVVKSEDKLRTKNEYDPKAVDSSKKQGAVSKYLIGVNPKKIPPYDDPAMQARVERIAQSLVPAYQRGLSDTDVTKINFRFQLVDEPKWRDTWTLPNGITLVPKQLVERMQNDSQLAAVLASDIACAIEKQTFREIPNYQSMTAAQIAGDIGGAFVPGLGIATGLANYKAQTVITRHVEEQSGRVSLVLLHDAGYDIFQAPLAWWLLAPKKPAPMLDTPLPERAAYLYQTIGTTWRSDATSEKTVHP